MGTMKRPDNSGTWETCPEGQYSAVLADIIDLGWQERVFEGQSQGLQPMIKLVWQVDEVNSEGKPFLVFDRKMKYSFHEKSALYARLCAWLGSKRIERMLDEMADIENLIGESAYLNIEQSAGNDGTVYANVSTIMPLPKGMPPLEIRDYERWCERDSWEHETNGNPPRKPEISAFEDPETARRLIAEMNGQQVLGGNGNGHAPAIEVESDTPDPAVLDNRGDGRKAKASELAQGYTTADDSVFDGEVEDEPVLTPPVAAQPRATSRRPNTRQVARAGSEPY